MLSILRSEFRPLAFGVAFIFAVELLVRLLPLYRFEKSEASLIESTRRKIEAGNNNYRVLIFGDSRSMSLNPVFGTDRFKDTYNFSLPAMGPRYYRSYLEKYLKAGNRKPEAILFVGSPLLLMAGKGQTLVDAPLLAYASPDISMLDYLKRRGPDRLQHISEELRPPKTSLRVYEELDWAYFSGRYMRMFSLSEVYRNYQGPERMFLLSSMLPLQWQSYRHREAILNALEPLNYRFHENGHGTDACSCELVTSPACQPPPSYYQDNVLVEQSRERRNGMYNISDRITPERLQMLVAADQEMRARFQAQSELEPTSDYSVLEDFLQFLAEKEIRYYYLNMPFPDYFRGSKYMRNFENSFTVILDRHPHAERLRFPTEFQPPELFPDQVHLGCEGARRVNAEFTGSVLPELYRRLDERNR